VLTFTEASNEARSLGLYARQHSSHNHVMTLLYKDKIFSQKVTLGKKNYKKSSF